MWFGVNGVIRPAQLRMARAALGWSLSELASKAKVHINTVSRCEAGYEAMSGTLQRLEDALRGEGIIFIDDDASIGVAVRRGRFVQEAPPVREKSKTKPKSVRKPNR